MIQWKWTNEKRNYMIESNNLFNCFLMKWLSIDEKRRKDIKEKTEDEKSDRFNFFLKYSLNKENYMQKAE